MAIEIERKFLLTKQPTESPFEILKIQQGYLSVEGKATLRIRITQKDKTKTATLCYKSKAPKHITYGVEEQEWDVPVKMGEHLLTKCEGHIIYKTRYVYEYAPLQQRYLGGVDLPNPDALQLFWEVDVFKKHLKGLIVAELEIPSEDFFISHPEWLGLEVTHDKRYKNKNLSKFQANAIPSQKQRNILRKWLK